VSVYANLESFEGSITSETTLSLARKSRKIVITNDHPTDELTFKFNASETAATLRGSETISMYFTTDQIILNGTNGNYRVWVFG